MYAKTQLLKGNTIMKKVSILCVLSMCAATSMSWADPIDTCAFAPVTFGKFDMGSWENADGTVVVQEPLVETGHWVTDGPSLKEEFQVLEQSCYDTAEKLIRRVSATFAGTLTQAEIFYDGQVQECKNYFGEIYEIYTGILCPPN